MGESVIVVVCIVYFNHLGSQQNNQSARRLAIKSLYKAVNFCLAVHCLYTALIIFD